MQSIQSIVGVIWALALLSASMTAYYGAVIAGIFKDPLMANFRIYGEERRAYPICRFLQAAAFCSWMLSMVVGFITIPGNFAVGFFPPAVFLVLALMSGAASLAVRRNARLREMLPQWYFELLRISTRQERRLIGFAWLKIPRKMRWRLNGDQAAFQSWVDTVRITVIYGAFDPENPWKLWT
ncbi:MAG: hypothetical protein GYB65_19405 [Chloroflexi bacterium]|nr:hypothetical protein [Chloroflexota bacterium]